MENQELSLKELFELLTSKKRLILKFIFIGALIGLFIGLVSPNEYKSTALILPFATESSGSSSLAGLASLAGINLSAAASEEISPELFSRLVASTPFTIAILNQEFYLSDSSKVTLYKYFTDVNRKGFLGMIIGIPFKIIKLFKADSIEPELKFIEGQPIKLSENQEKIIEELIARIVLTIDYTSKIVAIESKFQDPKLTAQVNNYILDYLLQYSIDYKTGKLKNDLVFLNQQVELSKAKYIEAQNNLAKFQDQNKFVSSEIVLIQQNELKTEVSFMYEIFSFLVKQEEQLKIKIQEQKELFAIIDPPQIPADESEPKKAILIISVSILSFLIAIFYLIFKKILA